jgi:hypothetical protein
VLDELEKMASRDKKTGMGKRNEAHRRRGD